MTRRAPALLTLALIAVLVALSIIPANAAPAGVPTNPGTTNLVSCWDLDETSGTRNDAYGTNHLTDNNTVGYAAGKVSNAGDFEYANLEYLSLSDNASISTGDIDFSFSAWVYVESLATSHRILSKRQNEATAAEYDLQVASNGTVSWIISNSVGGLNSINGSSTLAAGNWYWVYADHDAANNQIRVSINNGTLASSATTITIADSTAIFEIGGLQQTAARTWDGLIDTVTFYKRTLTTDERDWLYNSGSGRACADLNPPPTATPTATNTDTPTPTSTATNTPTATPIPGACSGGGVWTSSTWTNTAGSQADTCVSDNTRITWREPADAGSSVNVAYTADVTKAYTLTFEGYYTGGHTMTLDCDTGTGWQTLLTLATVQAADETHTLNLPAACNDGTPALRLYHSSSGNASHYLYVDVLRLDIIPDTATPTPSITPTLPATATMTPGPQNEVMVSLPAGQVMIFERRVTYGEVAVVVGLLLVGGVMLIKFLADTIGRYLRGG